VRVAAIASVGRDAPRCMGDVNAKTDRTRQDTVRQAGRTGQGQRSIKKLSNRHGSERVVQSLVWESGKGRPPIDKSFATGKQQTPVFWDVTR
jgi:hypothetical protein